MIGIVATALEIPLLAEAVRARGMELTILPESAAAPADASAALLGWRGAGHPGAALASLRAGGLDGPLLMVIDEGCGLTVAHALDAGADDAVTQPACPGEIAARIAARLRGRGPQTIRVGSLTIDPVARTAHRAGRAIPLLPREYALLACLAGQVGSCVSRAELLAVVWGLGFDPGTNVVEVHVSRLRAKLDRGHGQPLLHTERGRGYCLRPD